MNPILHISLKMFIRRFYAQNAGLFLFLVVIMAGIIETITGDNGMVLTYHYHLIMGMLGNNTAFCLILFLWALYGLKCLQFIINLLSSPETIFLQLLNHLPGKKILLLFACIYTAIYLPVLSYSFIIVGVAIFHHLYIKAFVVILFQLLVCTGGAAYCRQKTKVAGAYSKFEMLPGLFPKISKPYFSFLLSYLFTESKFLLFATKFFSCVLVFAFLHGLEQDGYDTRFMMLIYTMALAGHTVIIHKTREMEETRLTFYRQLPLARWRRWIQVVIFYIVLIIPEILIILRFVPIPLHTADSIYMVLFSLSFLLLQHAILSTSLLTLRQFLKIVLGVFMILYFFIVDKAYMTMIILLFIASTGLFIRQYYRFEIKQG